MSDGATADLMGNQYNAANAEPFPALSSDSNLFFARLHFVSPVVRATRAETRQGERKMDFPAKGQGQPSD
jgi:hypothetical protein